MAHEMLGALGEHGTAFTPEHWERADRRFEERLGRGTSGDG